MTCYLTITDDESECEGGCAEPVGPGLVAMTDEMRNRKLVPICANCLKSLDPRLAVVLRTAPGLKIIDIVVAET